MIKDNRIYLEHIKDSINQIKEYMRILDFNKFLNSRLYQSAIIRELEIVGEATKNLTIDFRKKHPDIPWKQIAGMRDKLIHGYMGVDLEDVWKTAKEEVIDLYNQVSEILKTFDKND